MEDVQFAHPLFVVVHPKKIAGGRFDRYKKVKIVIKMRGAEEMEYAVQNAVLTIKLPEELDHVAADAIRKETEKVMGKTFIRGIIFDFEDTLFMDSSGIGLIMGRYRALGLRGGCIQAVHVSKYMERMLRISGVHKYIHIQKEDDYGKHQ